MQHVTEATLKQRINKPLLDALIASAGLTIIYGHNTYLAAEGINTDQMKLVEGEAPLVRYSATCPQIPDLKVFNYKLGLVEFSTYNYLVKGMRFCVVVDGVEIFGSFVALRDHGFFNAGDEIKVITGDIDKSAFIRMEPLGNKAEGENTPFYRFFARSLKDLPKVHAILAARNKVKEISFMPESFDQLLHEDAFVKN